MKIKRHINKAKRVSCTCQNNNGRSYCRSSRLHNARKRKTAADSQIKEFKKGLE